MEVPEGFKQITQDKLLYKFINQEGDPSNQYASFNDSAVAIEYVIKTKDGKVVDYSNPKNPVIWIIGDQAAEGGLYYFLPIAVRTMRENEIASFYFDRTYLLGDGPLVSPSGEIVKSNEFIGIVHLIKARPLSYDITEDNSTGKVEEIKENKEENNNRKEHKEEIKENKEENNNKKEHKEEIKENKEKNNDKKEHKEEIKENKAENNNKKEEIKENKEENNDKKEENKENKEENNDKKEENKEKKEKTKENLDHKIAICALCNLSFAMSILESKPAAARKAFNKAKTAWLNNMNISNPPNIEILYPEKVNSPREELMNFVNSRASFGIAKTFLIVKPPNQEKAIVSLKNALDFDPNYEEATELLKTLGVDDNNKFPEFDSLILQQTNFWAKEISWEKRVEYAKWMKEQGNILYKDHLYEEANEKYSKTMISLQGLKNLGDDHEKIQQWYELSITSKLNTLACKYQLCKFKSVIKEAQSLLNQMSKSEFPYPNYKAKCLYRKALAHVQLSEFKEAEEIIKELGTDNKSIIQEIQKQIQIVQKQNKESDEFLFRKMTGK